MNESVRVEKLLSCSELVTADKIRAGAAGQRQLHYLAIHSFLHFKLHILYKYYHT